MYMWVHGMSDVCRQRVSQNRNGVSHTFRQGERNKFDRFVDPNFQSAKTRKYSNLRIYRNRVLSSTKNTQNICVPRFVYRKSVFIVSIVNHETLAMQFHG